MKSSAYIYSQASLADAKISRKPPKILVTSIWSAFFVAQLSRGGLARQGSSLGISLRHDGKEARIHGRPGGLHHRRVSLLTLLARRSRRCYDYCLGRIQDASPPLPPARVWRCRLHLRPCRQEADVCALIPGGMTPWTPPPESDCAVAIPNPGNPSPGYRLLLSDFDLSALRWLLLPLVRFLCAGFAIC